MVKSETSTFLRCRIGLTLLSLLGFCQGFVPNNAFVPSPRLPRTLGALADPDPLTKLQASSATPTLMDAYEVAWSTVVKCKESGEGASDIVKVAAGGHAQKLLNHMNSAADVCEFFGREVVVGEVSTLSIEFRNVGEDKSQSEFGYDPFWDDEEEEWTPSTLAGFDVGESEEEEAAEFFHDLPSSVPDSDEVVLEQSKRWVAALMSDMGICPFTQGHVTAGLPSGKVRYIVSRSKTVEEVYEDYWKEVNLLRNTDEKEVSTTLLICPEMWMKGNGSGEGFEVFSNTLTACLTGEVEDLLQLVFFHPLYAFRDGGERAAAAANYARRSPYPMINLLRTDQVRRGQKGIPTGLVYSQNEKTLEGVGADDLEAMLRARDWKGLEGKKVDRSEYDALNLAKGLQTAVSQGATIDDALATEKPDYASEIKDSDRDADKKASKEVEGSDLVNVLLQAVEKMESGERLKSAEAAVVAMAVGFIVGDDGLGKQ